MATRKIASDLMTFIAPRPSTLTPQQAKQPRTHNEQPDGIRLGNHLRVHGPAFQRALSAAAGVRDEQRPRSVRVQAVEGTESRRTRVRIQHGIGIGDSRVRCPHAGQHSRDGRVLVPEKSRAIDMHIPGGGIVAERDVQPGVAVAKFVERRPPHTIQQHGKPGAMRQLHVEIAIEIPRDRQGNGHLQDDGERSADVARVAQSQG